MEFGFLPFVVVWWTLKASSVSTVVLAVLLVVTRTALSVDNQIDDAATSSSVSGGRRGSCSASGLCCQSKNNTCRGTLNVDEDLNVVETQLVTGCFCDAACIDIGDCCDDYVSSCQREYTPPP